MQTDRVPGLPELVLEVGDDVHGEGDARAREVQTEDGDTGAVPGLERAVRKERVGEGVLDFRESALVLVAAVPDDGEHADDALEDHELQQRRVSEQRNGDARQQREVRVHLRVGPRPRSPCGLRFESGAHFGCVGWVFNTKHIGSSELDTRVGARDIRSINLSLENELE